MTRGGTPPAPPAYIGRESGVASRGGSKVGRGGAGMSRGGPASHSSVALGASSDLAVGVLHHGRYGLAGGEPRALRSPNIKYNI